MRVHEGAKAAQMQEQLLSEGQNCWRIEDAGRFAVIVDADAYFNAARQAMLAARQSILLIGWDFDARIPIGSGDDDGPEHLGDFILWLAKRRPELEIRLLRWDKGALKTLFRGRTLLTVLRWKAHPRITLQLDSKHPLASSHHQKIVAIDDNVAFCGGIDMTTGRWDRREHLDDDPGRIGPDGAAIRHGMMRPAPLTARRRVPAAIWPVNAGGLPRVKVCPRRRAKMTAGRSFCSPISAM